MRYWRVTWVTVGPQGTASASDVVHAMSAEAADEYVREKHHLPEGAATSATPVDDPDMPAGMNCRGEVSAAPLRKKLQDRIAEKQAEYDNMRSYLRFRDREEDLHGGWDGFINLSEISNYIDGLKFALAALEESA